MKSENINKHIISVAGKLNVDENGDIVVIVETKDSFEEIPVDSLINSLIGKSIKIYSEEDL